MFQDKRTGRVILACISEVNGGLGCRGRVHGGEKHLPEQLRCQATPVLTSAILSRQPQSVPPPPAEKPPTGGQLRGGRSIEMILVLEKTVFIRENAYGSTSFPKTAHFLGPTWKREGRGSGQEQRNPQSAGAGSVAVGHVPSSRPRGRVLQGCAPCPPVVSRHLTWRPERRWFPAGGNRRHPLKHPRPLTLTS